MSMKFLPLKIITREIEMAYKLLT